MSKMQIILIVLAAVLLIAYMARRGARKAKDRKMPR